MSEIKDDIYAESIDLEENESNEDFKDVSEKTIQQDKEENEPETAAVPEMTENEENKEESRQPGEKETEDFPGKEKKEEVSIRHVYEEIKVKFNELDNSFGKLAADFTGKIKYDEHKEKIIDNLHREVQEYKNDLIKNLLRPLIMDIIFTIDDISKLVSNYKSKDPVELDPLKLLKQMQSIGADLEDILARQGVEPYSYSQPQFEPKRQKVVKTRVTHDQSMDKNVSGQVQKGYQWEGKILRQERVNVYVYQPELENPEIDENKNEEEEL